MILLKDEEDEKGNLVSCKIEYSSDEEIVQIKKKMKLNENQLQITNFFSTK